MQLILLKVRPSSAASPSMPVIDIACARVINNVCVASRKMKCATPQLKIIQLKFSLK